MIDDLTLKARLMAGDANELQKRLPGGRRRPGWMPGSDKRRMGADNYNKLNEQQQNAQRGMQAHQKTESQNQAVADYRDMTANTPGIPYAAEYDQTAGGNTRGPKPNPANAYAKSARQQAKLQAQDEEGMQEPGENGSTVIPDQKTQVQSFNNKGEVVSNTTKETNKPQVPENTEQGGGNPNQDQSQTQAPAQSNVLDEKQQQAMEMFNQVQDRKKERLASAQTSTPAPAPAIPGSTPAPPAPEPTGTLPPPAPTGTLPPPPAPTGAPQNQGVGSQNFYMGGGQGQGQQGQQAPAAPPQNDPRTNARNMQVANATARSQQSGGLATNPLLGAMTFGMSNLAGAGWNAYQRGQGKKELAQMAKSPYSKVLSVFEIRKGISARNTTEVLRRGRI